MYQKDVSRSHINVLITYFRHSHPLIKHQMIFFKYHINHMRMLHDYTFLVVLWKLRWKELLLCDNTKLSVMPLT